MAKFQPWLKMWVEWIDDPGMLDLSLAEQGAWWRLVTLAKKCGADGHLVKGHGAPLSLDQIADALRIRTTADRRVFDSMVEKMTDQVSLHWNHATLIITHFAERQAKTTSETPEAVRARVRRYRERKSGIPPKNPPRDIDIEEEEEAEASSLHSVTCNGYNVTSEPALAKIATLHEQHFGQITPILSEKFKGFVEDFSGPVEWIDLAFAEAVKYKNRRWQYVEAILNSWQEKGGPHADRRGAKGEGTGTCRRDPLEGARATGWEVIGDDEPDTKTGDQG